MDSKLNMMEIQKKIFFCFGLIFFYFYVLELNTGILTFNSSLITITITITILWLSFSRSFTLYSFIELKETKNKEGIHNAESK